MERHNIDLKDIRLDGLVLDIGGGGEGVISRHVGGSVVSIDKIKAELEESPNVGIKIVMDATDMQFLDDTFDNANCFFSLMYMSDEDMEKVLQETFRILKRGGCLWIWDAIIPPSSGEDSFVIQLAIQIKNEIITTDYGVGWKNPFKGQSMRNIIDLCEKTGFAIAESSENEQSFFVKAVKT